MLTGGVLLGVTLTFVLPGVLPTMGSNQAQVVDTASGTTSDVLYLSQNDAQFLNRVYGQLDNEIGYCALVSGGGQIDPHLADTITASPDRVQFSTGNCPDSGFYELGLIHTHPNGDPNPSQQDRETLYQLSFAYSCIQSGEIDASIGQVSENFRCYRVINPGTEDEDIARVAVQLTD